jgi:hypothetical protein
MKLLSCSDCGCEFGASDAERGSGVGLEGAEAESVESASLGVDPGRVLVGQEWAAGDEHRHLGRSPRPVRVAQREG